MNCDEQNRPTTPLSKSSHSIPEENLARISGMLLLINPI